MVDVKMEPSWKEVLKDELAAPYFERLTNAVKLEYKANRCFPEGRNIFRAFDLCPFNDVKVVILGQDPYHEIGQAHGLSFSVQEGIAMPPSLINIFKELKNDIGKELPANGDLTHWAEQGVLLLNSTLTVRAHQAASHPAPRQTPCPTSRPRYCRRPSADPADRTGGRRASSW